MITVHEALQRRRSVRRFTRQPVARDQLARMLRLARRAPSGANLQPGRVHVLTAAPLRTLSQRLCKAFAEKDTRPEEYGYFPDPMPDHLKARQRAVGYALYNSLGIARRDIRGRLAQHQRNFQFFDAPVGMIVTIEAGMGEGCFMDLGMFLQSLFLAAEGEGFATCGIGALASYPHVIRDTLQLPDTERVVCGIALGYADATAPENQFATERADLTEFADFRGFDQESMVKCSEVKGSEVKGSEVKGSED